MDGGRHRCFWRQRAKRHSLSQCQRAEPDLDHSRDQLVGGVNLPTTPAEWIVAGIEDFTGSGTDAILWHNASTGQNLIWNMQNNQLVSGTNLPQTPLSWNISGVGVNSVTSGLATAPSGDPSQMVQAIASFAPSGGTDAARPIAQQPSDLNSQLVAPNSLH
jgi:hypothetical protein